MADEQIRIDITAENDASKVLDDVADDAEQLDKLEPEISVTADVDDASRGIKDVADDAERLARQDTEILLKARIDDAKGALKALRTDLDQTGEKAQQTNRELDKIGGDGGIQTRGNAIADLTGPLGDASGAASDFAGVFDGLGDIAGDVAGKVGLNAAVMSSAIGGIGIAVAAGAAAWTLFRQNQEKAAARQKELVEGQKKINDALREGNVVEAATEFDELYKGAIKAAESLGIGLADITKYLTEQNPAVAENLAHWQKNGDMWEQDIAAAIVKARDEYIKTNGTIAEQEERLRVLAVALGGTTRATKEQTSAQEKLEGQTDRNRDAYDRLRGHLNFDRAFQSFQEAMWAAMTATEGEAQTTQDEIRAIEDAIFDVAEFAKLSPIQVKSLLDKVSRGDLAGVQADITNYYNANKVPIATALKDPTSYDAAVFRQRMTDAIGEVPVRGRLTTVRSGNVQVPV